MKISRSRSSLDRVVRRARGIARIPCRRGPRPCRRSRRSASRGACASIALKRPAETSQARGFAGHAVARPLLEGRGECLVHRLLRAVEIAEQADQRREHAPRFLAIDGLDRACAPRPVRLRGSTARTSTTPPCGSVGMRSASASASSRSRHSTQVIPAELLLGLGERPVDDDCAAVLQPDRVRARRTAASFARRDVLARAAPISRPRRRSRA